MFVSHSQTFLNTVIPPVCSNIIIYACRSFRSFSRRSLSEVSVSSNCEADSLVLLSSASSANKSAIWTKTRIQNVMQKPLSGSYLKEWNSATNLQTCIVTVKGTHLALQSICVQSQLISFFLHPLEFQFLLLYLLLSTGCNFIGHMWYYK